MNAKKINDTDYLFCKFNVNHRKEQHFTQSYVGLATVSGEIEKVVDLRIYETAARAYACIWIFGAGKMGNVFSGSGYASGYGYHRSSEAASQAIRNAKVELSERIGGMGHGAIEAAVLAITKAVYPGLPEGSYKVIYVSA